MQDSAPLQTIDDIRLEEKLGQGVHSTVYRAQRNGTRYALKLQKSRDPADSDAVRRRFIREAATLARLDHPSLPHVWTIGEFEDRMYLVMDYIEGTQLDELDVADALDVTDLARIGFDVCSALAELHAAGLVHRDIKPSNIIWDGEQAHLVDFGLVGLAVDHLSDDHDATSTVVGTLAYASPEQLRALKRPVDARSDLYGVGAVLYHAIAGRPPYDTTEFEELMRAHAAEEPSPLAEHDTRLDATGLHEVIERLIAKEPAARYQSALDAARAFDSLHSAHDPESDLTEETSPVVRVEDLQVRLRQSGRRDELNRVQQAWSYYRQTPNGLCTLITSREGLGREQFVTQALNTLDGAELTLRATSDRTEDSQPLDAISDLVKNFLRTHRDDRFDPNRLEALNTAADALPASQPIRHFLHRITGDATDDRTPLSSLRTHQFIGELARLIGSFTAEMSPSVIAVDRVERLDLTSSLVLRRLCYLLEQFDIFLLLSVDPDITDTHNLYDDIRGDLAFLDDGFNTVAPPSTDDDRTPTGVELNLSSLTTDDVVEYLSVFLNTDFQEVDFADQLRAASGGSPVILDQLLEVLIETLVIRPDWNGWAINRDRWQEVDIPNDTRELLADRLDGIDAELLELCGAAAVWGHEFYLQPLADTLEWSDRQIASAAERATHRDLFVEVSDNTADYKFVHPSVRQSLLERTPDDRRQRWHQAFAEWIDDRGSLQREANWSFDLAFHYARGDGSTPERTFELCWRAGRSAAENFAFDRTRTFLEAALHAADQLDADLPAELSYLLGWAYAELGEFEQAESQFRQAIERAESPFEKARYQIRWADMDATRLEVEPLESGTRRVLELLDVPLPTSSFGTLLWILPRFVQNQWWERTSRPSPATGDRKLSLKLLSRAFDLLGMAAVFGEKDLLSISAEVGRMHTALQLGDSPELARAYASSATLAALLDRETTARRQLERGHRVADQLDSPYASLKIDLAHTWVDHILGDPVGAAERAAPLLENKADQLSLLDHSLALEELSVNYGLRGYSERVRHWFREWYSTHEVRTDKWPPSTMYSTAMVHARLCGDNDTADELRDVSRESVQRQNRSIYFRKSHLSAITFDNVLLGKPPDAVEIPLRERLDLGSDPGETVFWAKTFFIHAAYARRYLLDHPDTDDTDHRLETFEIAVQRLESAAGTHPTLRAHALVMRAGFTKRAGDLEGGLDFLNDAEQLATDHRVPWVLFEVARERAHWLRERQQQAPTVDPVAGRLRERHRLHARDAANIADDLGWQPRAHELHRSFDISAGSATNPDPPTGSHTSTSEPSGLSTRQIELQRKLDALLEVSMATSSIIDPDEVSEVVVDAAIRVLGAQRGLLFLNDDGDDLERRQPRVVRTTEDYRQSTDDTADNGSPPFSRTIVDQVTRTGEAVVVRGTREGADIGAESIVAHDIRSVIAAPLFFDDRLVGAIYLDNRLAGGVFDDGDVEVLQAIANHIPVALETARTAQLEVEVAAERERRTYAETLRQFTQNVNEMLDVADILSHLLDHLSQSLDIAEAWGLQLPENGEPTVHAHLRGDRLLTRPFGTDTPSPPDPGELISAIADAPSVRTISPISDEDRQREPFIGEETQTWVAIPLGTGRRPVGIAVLTSPRTDAFDPADVEQALALADQAGVAIEKAILANNDPLTGVYNRRKFFEVAAPELDRCRREEAPLCALLLDVDNFKAINDEFGHAAGDRALEQLADICQDSTRRYDTIARYGGEEFAILLPSTDLEHARHAVAERLRENIEQTDILIGEKALNLTVSVGLAQLRDDDETPHHLLERADDAMYLAKRRGKNRVAAYGDAD